MQLPHDDSKKYLKTAPYQNLALGILFANFLIFPFTTTIYDEIISCLCIIFIFVKRGLQREVYLPFQNLKIKHFPQLYLVSFLCLNAGITFLVNRDSESLKWWLFYVLLGIIIILLRDFQLTFIKFKILFTGFSLYAIAIIITYYVSEIIFKVPFFENQSKIFAGTTTYMITILVMLHCINRWLMEGKFAASMFAFLISYWSIHLSASRTGLISIFSLALVTTVSRNLKIVTKLFILLGFLCCFLVVPKMHEQILYITNTTIEKPSPIDIIQRPREIPKSMAVTYIDSAKFFLNPRGSDEDRHKHFICALEEFKNLNWLEKAFGVGPSKHRELIGKCLQAAEIGYARSTSVSRILLDSGLVGTVLMLFCIFYVAVGYLKARNVFAILLIIQFTLANYLQDQGNLLLVWLGILCINFFNLGEKVNGKI